MQRRNLPWRAEVTPKFPCAARIRSTPKLRLHGEVCVGRPTALPPDLELECVGELARMSAIRKEETPCLSSGSWSLFIFQLLCGTSSCSISFFQRCLLVVRVLCKVDKALPPSRHIPAQ